MTQIVLIAIYFGKLPPNMPLWLVSAAANTNLSWVVITDQPQGGYTVPSNVRWEVSSLAAVRLTFERRLGRPVCLNRPYKLCDYKPFFWMLLDEYNINCTHWGHCDLDLVFGNIKKFITNDIIASHGRMLEDGHLSLYRNDYFGRNAPFLNGSAFSWTKVVETDVVLGFDEHFGVNQIWDLYGLRFWKNKDIVLDLLPYTEGVMLTNPLANFPRGLCFYRGGAVYRGYYDLLGRWKEVEYLYAHFQKRQFLQLPEIVATSDDTCYVLGSDGIYAIQEWPPRRKEFQVLCRSHSLLMQDWRKFTLQSLRQLRRRLIGPPSFRPLGK